MVTSKQMTIFSRLIADTKATGFSRYVVYLLVVKVGADGIEYHLSTRTCATRLHKR